MVSILRILYSFELLISQQGALLLQMMRRSGKGGGGETPLPFGPEKQNHPAFLIFFLT